MTLTPERSLRLAGVGVGRLPWGELLQAQPAPLQYQMDAWPAAPVPTAQMSVASIAATPVMLVEGAPSWVLALHVVPLNDTATPRVAPVPTAQMCVASTPLMSRRLVVFPIGPVVAAQVVHGAVALVHVHTAPLPPLVPTAHTCVGLAAQTEAAAVELGSVPESVHEDPLKYQTAPTLAVVRPVAHTLPGSPGRP